MDGSLSVESIFDGKVTHAARSVFAHRKAESTIRMEKMILRIERSFLEL